MRLIVLEKQLKMSNWSSVALVLTVVASALACEKHHREEHFAAPRTTAPAVPAPRPPPPAQVDGAVSPEEAGVVLPRDAGGRPVGDAEVPLGERDAAVNDASSGNTDSTDERPPVVLEFTKRRLLESAAQCALEHYQGFAARAQVLADAVAEYADSPSSVLRQAAQQAFIEAMQRFQLLELFRMGPAARSMDPGGRDLRDLMYAFPQTNRCQIDRHLVSRAYAADVDQLLFNARGLGALEYLLFNSSSENGCSAVTDINAIGSWAALSEDERASRRAEYASAVAHDVERQAKKLVQAWLPTGENFAQQFVEAGERSQVYASQQAALNALSHALFYVDKEVKDYKLGWPLGMVAECISGHCPEAVESPYARVSLDNIAGNLHAFRLVFEGCQANYEGLGFDDWLRAAYPEGDLDERMLEALKQAQRVVADFEGSLEVAFYDDPEAARRIHAAIKSLTDLLKTEFVSVLNLELPMTAEGDND